MAKEKDAKELVELAAEQGSHAAKNVGRAAQEAVGDIVPSPKNAVELSLRMSQPVALGVGAALVGFGTVKLVRNVKQIIAIRRAKEATQEKSVRNLKDRMRRDSDSDAA